MIRSADELPTELGPDHAVVFVDDRTRYSIRKTGEGQWTLYGHFRPARPTRLSVIWRDGDRWVAEDVRGGRKIRNVALRALIEGCLT